ncbi:hypothetical protein L7F22_033264 [Adiantum nelumboides]|nr:hypothetical protein [Adiantum nelumboides]
MDAVAMAEELAWLVKDNLSCKHLVLSAEEAFVAFLDSPEISSAGHVLTLEPMAAYHRMLLHRLADIFRLAHESIGEGEDRRLVLERCEDSCIPRVLVSDVLECNEVAHSYAPLILKRNKDCLGVIEGDYNVFKRGVDAAELKMVDDPRPEEVDRQIRDEQEQILRELHMP